jgi:TolB-like protein
MISLLLAGAARAAEAPLVAVLEFRNEVPGIDKKTDRNGDYLADVARSALAARRLGVMTRENLVVLLRSSGSSVSDCIDKCEIETGRLVGAEFVLSGSMVQFGDELRLSMRLHDTRSGTLLAGDMVGGPDVRSLEAALPPALARMVSRIPGADAAMREDSRPYEGLSLALLGGGGALFALGEQVAGHEQSGAGIDTVVRVGWGLGRRASVYLEGALGGIRFSCCSGMALHRSLGAGAQSRIASLGRAELSATLSLARTINDAPGTGFAGLQPERRWELSPAIGIELLLSERFAVGAETWSPISLYPGGLSSVGLRAGVSYR